MNAQPIVDRFVYVASGGCCCVSGILLVLIVWLVIAKRKR